MIKATTRFTTMNLEADEGFSSPVSNRVFFKNEVATHELEQTTKANRKP